LGDFKDLQSAKIKWKNIGMEKKLENLMGHNHLLEIQLLKKSARHDFINAQHRLSNNIFSCQLLESS
jgi:hypothetical protein